MSLSRNFQGVWIPRDLWLDANLSIMQKAFLVEINSLDMENGCFASNKHFSSFSGLSKNRCSEIIKSLEAKSLIKIKLIRDGKRVSKRIIRIKQNKNFGLFANQNKPIRETEHPYSENSDTPIRETEHPYS